MNDSSYAKAELMIFQNHSRICLRINYGPSSLLFPIQRYFDDLMLDFLDLSVVNTRTDIVPAFYVVAICCQSLTFRMSRKQRQAQAWPLCTTFTFYGYSIPKSSLHYYRIAIIIYRCFRLCSFTLSFPFFSRPQAFEFCKHI
jgi:hypothetical protein